MQYKGYYYIPFFMSHKPYILVILMGIRRFATHPKNPSLLSNGFSNPSISGRYVVFQILQSAAGMYTEPQFPV